MNRTVAGAARVAGGALMALAVLPVVLAGPAQAAGSPAPTPYADQVAIGTAIKIANPAAVGGVGSVGSVGIDAAGSAATATPSDAIVIETESHQAGTADPTDVAVLGTKVGSTTGTSDGTLAETGPGTVTVQALLALLLILAGAALRGGPRLAVVARRASNRRH